MRYVVVGLACVLACGNHGADTSPIDYGTIGPLVGDAGKGSWRFGVATASEQIEDMNTATDWYLWTEPVADGGLGNDTFVGSATDGYTMDMSDLALIKQMGLDSYRFSIEWARIEPVQGQIDEDAIQHYRDELQALHDMGIRPIVTVHHYSMPVWVDDPRDPDCMGSAGSGGNLCGFGGGMGSAIAAAMGAHAALLAQRFGDLVDEWGTINEPVPYLLAAYGTSQFPPGKGDISDVVGALEGPVRDYIAAHVAMYNAIKANDTIDADGDGVAAAVGMSMSVADFEPARKNEPSTNPDDIAARDRVIYIFHYLFVDAITTGMFDSDFDGTPDESHPEWANTLDWLGLQYYSRAGVTADPGLLDGVTPCTSGLDFGACLPAPDPTYCVPQMGYESWPDGFEGVLEAYAQRYPTIPLVVTESGIASDSGRRHAENLVRSLETVEHARAKGVDVRGFYEWSLTDNFEWAKGFAPHFGLYSVDYTSYARTPTEGATVFGQIAQSRTLTQDQREMYGGTGSMTPDPQGGSNAYCPLVSD
ncbi:MAG TPA: family 1 glycosylhydrolase [Kofleriaceae bacterium]|jgi:beta-glucosidase